MESDIASTQQRNSIQLEILKIQLENQRLQTALLEAQTAAAKAMLAKEEDARHQQRALHKIKMKIEKSRLACAMKGMEASEPEPLI